MHRSRGRAVLAVIFAILSADAFAEVLLAVLGYSDTPATLVRIQSLVALSAAAAAWGSWRGSRWAWLAALGYGLVTGAMIAALGPLLDLGPEASRGLWAGAAVLFVFGAWAAWYLHRPLAPAAERAAAWDGVDPDESRSTYR